MFKPLGGILYDILKWLLIGIVGITFILVLLILLLIFSFVRPADQPNYDNLAENMSVYPFLISIDKQHTTTEKAVFFTTTQFDLLLDQEQYLSMFDIVDSNTYMLYTGPRYNYVEFNSPSGMYLLDVASRRLHKPDGTVFDDTIFSKEADANKLSYRIENKKPEPGDPPDVIADMFGSPDEVITEGHSEKWNYEEGFTIFLEGGLYSYDNRLRR